MRSAALKIGVPLLLSILTIEYPCLPVVAQTEEEMKILAMFYREKELVVTPTRHAKPISQVAENITVVTAKEIEEMNAHTVAEVLNRVTGLFVNFNQDFGATSLLHIQGSEQRHVLVLLDSIPWNFLSDGAAETNTIPVGIIERIEIIKGPASSTWGSALGGVINILTKPVGDAKRLTGALSGSYGERKTQDYRGQVAGNAGHLGYYLFAGKQESDGLRSSRYFDNYSLYSKFNIAVSDNVDTGLSVGYSQPNVKLGEFTSGDILQTGSIRTFYATGFFDAFITRELSLNLSFHSSAQKSVIMNDALGLGLAGPPGELFLETISDEETKGAQGNLVWDRGVHTAVFGVDFNHGALDQTLHAGPLLQFMGVPAISTTSPRIDRWAVYANDTITIDKWSVTPGIRYDRSSITESFISPSLGFTYRLEDHSILRAAVARGFTIPPLSSTSGGGLFIDPNPTLEPEEVWSYQAGAESDFFKYLWVKATFFRHDLKKALTKELFAAGPPTFNDLIVNDGEIKRHGVELEAKTVPVRNVSLWAGYAYVGIEPANESGADEIYSYNLGIRYDDEESLRAQLFGHYIWWDTDPGVGGSYDDFVWDFILNKKIYSKKTTSSELFFTAHNLFNGSQYPLGDNKNPRRWVEAGIRLKFYTR